MRCKLLLIVLAFVVSLSKAQQDSILRDENFKMTEGLYLSYSDFRRNAPVTRDKIESGVPKDHLDFFGKTVALKQFTVETNGEKTVISSNIPWGYYQNTTVYVNFKGEFYRIPVFGAISYFVAIVDVPATAMYTPGYGTMGMGTTMKTQETREFLMNFYDGKIIPFSMDYVEELLQKDEAIYKEFKSLGRKKRKEQVSRYIRRYNDQHPVYFLK